MSLTAMNKMLRATTNPMSCRTLDAEVQALAYAVLSAQANALVLVRQPSVQTCAWMLDGGNLLSPTQARMTKSADHFLSAVESQIIGVIADISSACILVDAFNRLLSQQALLYVAVANPAASKQLSDLFNGLRAGLQPYAARSEACSQSVERSLAQAMRSEKLLADELDALVARLTGPDGAIADARAQVLAVQDKLAADLAAILKGGDEIGQGVKSIVTAVFTVLSPSPSSKASGKAPVAKAESGLPVEGIAAIKSGGEDTQKAAQAYDQDLKTLAELYQKLSALNATVAVAQAILFQASAFTNAFQQVAEAAAGVDRAWGGIMANLDQFSSQAAGLQSNDQAAMLSVTLKIAAQGWSQLQTRAQPIQATLMGAGSLVPPASSALTS